ncbi:ectoine utilization protein EutA, partial [Mesorhizobium sp. M7A.F.Ca.CA.004.06.1.1]
MKPLPEIKIYPKRPALDARPLDMRIGLIILATDHTSEPDFRRMVASERVGVYVAR